MSAHFLIQYTFSAAQKWPRTRAWHCVAKVKSIGALADIVGFIVVLVSLSIVPLLQC